MNNLNNKIDGINVLELRNYLLKPKLTKTFQVYFHQKFVAPMLKLNGFTLGEFAIEGVEDRFVWLRGFTDMKSRLQFLNDFYLKSDTWKEFGGAANEMMINSDNVHLLKPIYQNEFIISSKRITVIDFYICNNNLERAISLFEKEYFPFLKSINVTDFSFWTSEMQENDFPRLPAFQDKNLLLSITNYTDEKEYEIKRKQIQEMPESLKISLMKTVTIHRDHKLINLNYEDSGGFKCK